MFMSPYDQVHKGWHVPLLDAVLSSSPMLHPILMKYKDVDPVLCGVLGGRSRAHPGQWHTQHNSTLTLKIHDITLDSMLGDRRKTGIMRLHAILMKCKDVNPGGTLN